VVLILCVGGGLAAVWPAIRRRVRARHVLSPRVLVLAAAVVASGAGAGIATAGASGGSPGRGGLVHGRTVQWHAAINTWLDRPLVGAGAGTYYQASLPHQGMSPTRFAHDLPLELAAELGVGGLALGVALYAAATLALVRTRKTAVAWLLGPAVATFLIANLFDWPWHLAGLGAVWSCAVGALIAFKQMF
jgi:O-antigen ligase